MARKCAKCGVVSEIEEAFQKSDSSDEIFYCPACSKEKSIQLGESFLLAFPILLTVGFVLVMVNPRNEFAWLIFAAGLFMCFIVITTAPHELGHVLAAVITKATIFQVTIGLGLELYTCDFWGIEWKFCAIPICGSTYAYFKNKKFYRLRSFLVSLGGPLANFLMGLVAIIVLRHISSPLLSMVIIAFIVANGFELVFNLLPRKANVGGTLMSSDGLRLLTVLSMSDSKIDKEIVGYYIWQGCNLSEKGRFEEAKRNYEEGLARFPDSLALQSGRGRILSELGNYVDARDIFVQLQKNNAFAPSITVHILNEIATADIMIGTKDLLDEADAYSKTACEKMPWQPEFKGTRGLVLAKKGHIEEGLTLLKEAIAKTDNPSYKATYASYIAEYESKKSNAV